MQHADMTFTATTNYTHDDTITRGEKTIRCSGQHQPPVNRTKSLSHVVCTSVVVRRAVGNTTPPLQVPFTSKQNIVEHRFALARSTRLDIEA